MKQTIAGLLLCLFSSLAFASGKLSLQNNLHDDGKTYRPMVGFNVYEPVFKHLAVNLWTGYGVQPLESVDDVQWYVAKGQFDLQFGKVTISPGLQYKRLVSGKTEDLYSFFKIDYQLW